MKSIAISALLVQAKDETAKRFYLRCAEFVEFSGEEWDFVFEYCDGVTVDVFCDLVERLAVHDMR